MYLDEDNFNFFIFSFKLIYVMYIYIKTVKKRDVDRGRRTFDITTILAAFKLQN